MTNLKTKYAGKLIFAIVIILSIVFTKENVVSQDFQTGLISKWYWTQPSPTGNFLKSVFFINENMGFAAGELGTIIKTTNGGMNWNSSFSNTMYDLNEIYFINEKSGFAVGQNGVILNTFDGGDSWSVNQTSIKNYPDLNDIIFCNELTGYACGLNGTIIKSIDGGRNWIDLNSGFNFSLFCINFLNQNIIVAGGYGIIMNTTNGGINWSYRNINPPCAIKGISFIDEKNIKAAGDLPGGLFLNTTNGGNNWSLTSLGLPYLFGGSVDLVRSMEFKDLNTGYIVTDFATILKTTDSGFSWERDSSFRPTYEKLSVMYDVNLSGKENVNITGSGGSVFISNDAGENWSVRSGNRNSLRDCRFADSKTGIAVGEKGEILKTSDGGDHWTALNPVTGKFLNTVFTLSESIFYVAGDSGAIFRTTDGGNSWSDQTNYKKYDIHGIYFTGQETGLAAGGYRDGERAFIYKTTNAGVNWFEVYDSLGLGELNSITFTNEYFGYCAGNNGNILRTYDGGFNWESENKYSGDLYSVSFRDIKNGLISGEDGAVLKTTNGGYDWEYRISGFYKNLFCIKYLKNNLAYSGGKNGTILFSNDGGMYWIQEMKITNNDIYSIESNNNNKIFAGGEYGSIINTISDSPVLIAKKENYPLSKDIVLFQNYPNPFNPVTKISFEIKNTTDTKLTLFDISGKELEVLLNNKLSKGNHQVSWDAKHYPSGVYFYRIETADNVITRRMLLVK